MRTITVVTATRAEYGLLRPVVQKIAASDVLDLQLVVTGRTSARVWARPCMKSKPTACPSRQDCRSSPTTPMSPSPKPSHARWEF